MTNRFVRSWPPPAPFPRGAVPAGLAALALLATIPAPLLAQSRRPADTLDMGTAYARRTAMIPMRDGARLYTEIYSPRGQRGPLPILIERTPYDARAGVTGFVPTDSGYSTRLHDHTELARDGYIFVFQDLRGRFRSTGEYRTLRPPRDSGDRGGGDESTDTWDTIDWLVRNVADNNGRVGVLGISYGGFTTLRAMLGPHPALKAASPQASCADMFVGDDWHHNGAFRLDYAFRWVAAMERGKGRAPFRFDRADSYQWFLELGPLSAVNERYFGGKVPSWNSFVDHPNLDRFWETEMCGVLPFIRDLPVPTLNVAGWFDAEDFYGPLEIYRKLETFDRNRWNHLVVGPWTHGGWVIYEEGDRILDIDLGSPTSRYFRETIQRDWFGYWLKDRGRLELPEVRAFQTGSNQWESFDAWPPASMVSERKLYLHPAGRLSFQPPEGHDGPAFAEYRSDPASPVPYRERPIRGAAGWPEWQLEDQRIAHGRPDVLVWESAPLLEDITITGEVVSHLFASTTGTDADWIVKLIDVYPERYPPNPKLGGYQLMVAGEVFRARFRNSFRKPEPVEPGAIEHYPIGLRDRNHRFRAGHRIMVQIQSTWFPLIDRNPQHYVASIFKAQAGDFRPATHRVYHSPAYPTHLSLPVRRPP